MSLRVTLIQGGGLGLGQVAAVKRVVAAAGVEIEWDEHLAGLAALDVGGPALPQAMLESIRQTGLALKTQLLSPDPGNFNVQFRRELGVFASVRRLRNLGGLPARFRDVDVLLIRELTEDLYAAIEHEIVPGVVESIKVVTEAACQRFFRFAFQWASASGRKTVHCVHKANILKLADGLILQAFRATARDFPWIQAREIIVDNCCMQMVSRPHQFDVLVAGNLYGDLLSDLGAGIVGGINAANGINIGDGVRVYESYHGLRDAHPSAEQRAHANPLPLLLPALDLLEATGHGDAARRIHAAVETVLTDRRARTPDLGGDATTHEMTDAILAALTRPTTA